MVRKVLPADSVEEKNQRFQSCTPSKREYTPEYDCGGCSMVHGIMGFFFRYNSRQRKNTFKNKTKRMGEKECEKKRVIRKNEVDGNTS